MNWTAGKYIQIDWSKTKFYASASFNVAGYSSTFDTEIGYKDWTWGVVFSGTITSCDIRIEMSNDGTNWYEVDSSTLTENYEKSINNKNYRYVRFRVVTLAGTSPVVSIWICAVR